jgi:hypothetical protein
MVAVEIDEREGTTIRQMLFDALDESDQEPHAPLSPACQDMEEWWDVIEILRDTVLEDHDFDMENGTAPGLIGSGHIAGWPQAVLHVMLLRQAPQLNRVHVAGHAPILALAEPGARAVVRFLEPPPLPHACCRERFWRWRACPGSCWPAELVGPVTHQPGVRAGEGLPGTTR